MSNITLGQAGLYAVLGYAIVFFGLALLMLVVMLFGKIFSVKKKAPAPVGDDAHIVPEKSVSAPTAPGAAGGVKLHGVEPKTAAMLMAIVADKLGKPLNELRFISIKEVEK